MNFNHATQQNLITIFLTLTVFFLPISVSLQSIFLVLSLIAIILFQYQDLHQIIKTLWFFATTLLFILIIVDCFISPASHNLQWQMIAKYGKLLCLPILVLGFKNNYNRQYAIHAFLFAMLITAGLSLLKTCNYLVTFGDLGDVGSIFHNRIITGYYMAFAAFIAAIYMLRTTKKKRIFYALLALIYTGDIFFINTSRTGYVVFVAAMCVLLIYNIKSLKFFLIFITIILVWMALYNPVKDNIINVIRDIKQYSHGDKNTRVGFRLQFHQYAKQLFLRSPIIGLGTGSFNYYFDKEQPIPAWSNKLFEPHSAYWLILVENGIVGLVILLLFFGALFYTSLKIKKGKILMHGLLLTFMLCCLSDGMLIFSTGYFFLIFISIGLGESLQIKLLSKG